MEQSSALWASRHQYVDRRTTEVRTEPLFGDAAVARLYAPLWENGPALYGLLTHAWSSRLLGFLQYDAFLRGRTRTLRDYLEACGADLGEAVEPPERLDTPRKLFERQIRFWECRPMPEDPQAIVAAADARVLVGSLRETSALFLKGKFFDLEELLGRENSEWLEAFAGAEYAIHRLTPDKYHYAHSPVAGRVREVYEIAGRHHACNPGAVVAVVTPYSKNRRVVTVMDTDIPGGTGVGLVAMIEVAALMVGDVVQCYSSDRYEGPRPIGPGLFMRRGAVKSLFRPGGSTVVLLFQAGRVRFAPDILQNLLRPGVETRFCRGFGRPLVETDVAVRSLLATKLPRPVSLADGAASARDGGE